MASGGGFASGLGLGLQGMAQSLSNYVALKQQEKDRAERARERDEDLAFRKSQAATENEHFTTTQQRLDQQNERAIITKALEGIAKPERVSKEYADRGRKAGLEPFFHAEADMPIMGPKGTFMGGVAGASLPKAVMEPMISAKDQAQIAALKDRSANDAERLDLTAQRNQALAAYQQALGNAAGSNAQNNIDKLILATQFAEYKAAQAGATLNSNNYNTAFEHAIKAANARFSDMDRLMPDFGANYQKALQEELQKQLVAQSGQVQGGQTLFPNIHAPEPPQMFPTETDMRLPPPPGVTPQGGSLSNFFSGRLDFRPRSLRNKP